MKNRMAFRLSAYFALVLLAIAVMIGFVFAAFFKQHTMNMAEKDLEKRAVVIAEKLSSYMSVSTEEEFEEKKNRQGEGYGAFIHNLNEWAMADVWIVDKDLDMLVTGRGEDHNYTYADLPLNAEEVVSEVFAGKTTFSESFSNLLNTPTLTVGTPILDEAGNIVGVVLLHTSVEGIDEATGQGIAILFSSILIAFIVTAILSFLFSLQYTKPLLKLKNTTLQLAEGDYNVKTGIERKDEIGVLAKSVDMLSERLADAEKQSERFDKMRNDFVANVSHELRTPVTVIRGSLEALLDGVVTDTDHVNEYYRRMLAESKVMQRLIGDLLDLSRLQNTDFQIQRKRIYLGELLDDVMRSAKGLAIEKSIVVEAVNDAANAVIMGDYDRVRQMFMIVIDNAVKFSDAGGKVEIRLAKKENWIIATVRDWGRGIPQGELQDIFDRYYKLEDPQNTTGSGLGLAIAKQIAVRHGIEIEVKSAENAGSEFTFKIKAEE